jgi:uroporphyrinogen decarboxylase
MMTPRERFNRVIHFKKPDVLPWLESFYDETLLTWFEQGFPAEKVTSIEWSMGRKGTLLGNWPSVTGFDPYSYFGCISFYGRLLPIDIGPIPRFKQSVIGETDRYIEFLTETGAKAKRIKEYSWYSMPMFTEFPIKDRTSWERYKERLNPKDPRRYPKDWDPEGYMKNLEKYDLGPTLIRFNGFYGFGAELMGIPTFNVMFYKDPELIHEMVLHWEYYIIETLREAVETLKDQIDMVFWWEDLADRHGPCISPKLFQEYLLPHYQTVTRFLRKNKIDRIMMDSDGNIKPILDLIIEAGITGVWPLEVNSNMNALELKKIYGEKLFLIGNLDKRELAKGGVDMKREVDQKVLPLKDLGGYIPGADHLIHGEFTLKSFTEYVDYIKKLL